MALRKAARQTAAGASLAREKTAGEIDAPKRSARKTALPAGHPVR